MNTSWTQETQASSSSLTSQMSEMSFSQTRTPSMSKSRRSSKKHRSSEQGGSQGSQDTPMTKAQIKDILDDNDCIITKVFKRIGADSLQECTWELNDTMTKGNRVIRKIQADNFDAMVVDSRIISKTAKCANKLTETLEVTDKTFQPKVFAQKVKEFMRAYQQGTSSQSQRTPSQSQRTQNADDDDDKLDFAIISIHYGKIVRNPKTAYLVDIERLNNREPRDADKVAYNGRVNDTPPKGRGANNQSQSTQQENAVVEKRQRKRTKLDLNQELVRPELVNIQTDKNVDETLSKVQAMKQRLEEMYDRNKQRPVRYIEWVCDKNSFGKTVENTFHGMFLVKDGSVRLGRDERTDRATVEPVTDENTQHEDSDESDNDQAIIKLDYQQWHKWVGILA